MTRLAASALLVLLILAPPAFGAGGPVAGSDAGPAGVTVRGNPSRFVALPKGDATLIARIDRRGGTVSRHRILPGRLVVPAVAYDGSATGLSADGETLVLASPRFTFPRRTSTFTILDTERLRRHGKIRLRGDFTLDAISPDGGTLYLIESTSKDDLTRYAVRAYDVEAQRLLPDPVVDPAEADEPMRGMPIARAYSPEGRWAYTLYDAPEHPFIHALDTERATAKCIDLDQLSGRDDLLALSLHVGPDGTIAVRHVDGERPELVVDPRTFAVREPAQPSSRPRARAAEDDGSSGWLIISAGLGLIALVAIVRHRRVRDNVQPYAASRLERDVL
jgi:MYXO-CTERM domain-containing protein